jgi:hypothetical protein
MPVDYQWVGLHSAGSWGQSRPKPGVHRPRGAASRMALKLMIALQENPSLFANWEDLVGTRRAEASRSAVVNTDDGRAESGRCLRRGRGLVVRETP